MTTPSEQPNVQQLLAKMADEIKLSLSEKAPLIIGIHTGGVWVANKLVDILGDDFFDDEPGILNIAYYRDDFTRIGMHPQVQPSDISFEVEGRHLLLVDDVLHSGRTIRAALNEIFDYGRPASITLAVLIERNGRELPIQPDIIGGSIELERNQHIKLTDIDDNLALIFKTNEASK